MPDNTPTNRAVFLSYAREDSSAAKRIAEALRGFGLEVWFDQNELRGGDSWDTKIRNQIRGCALFVPVISASTQAREEGYFRREWKLAVDRTHDMADGRTFIVPVLIDDTGEYAALVPEDFRKVHWTKLPGGQPSPEFVAQVKRLLEAPRAVASTVSGGPSSREAGQRAAAAASRELSPPHRSGPPAWTWGALTAIVVGIATALFVARKPEPPAPVLKPPSPSLSTPAAAADKSIAVLPFANLSTDKENEFFADGVHDDVITSLAKIRDLKVISRTSVLAYRDPASRNLKKIATELGVATVLEGSIRRVGSKVHMNAQLIDARTDEHLWADTFDGDASDIFALQAKLAQQIASALKATLTAGERTRIERRPTENQEAYDLYLRARTQHQEAGEGGKPEDYERIIAIYEQAVALDPTFALAHAQVGLVHDILYWFAYLDPSAGRAAKAKAAVDAAVRLAPDLPETHLALGAYYYRIDRDWNRALGEFGAAEPGLPNDAQLFFWLAVTHRRLGHWEKALGYFERALALNPRELATASNYADFQVELRRWDQANDAAVRSLAYFPGDPSLFFSAAQARFGRDGDRGAYAKSVAAIPQKNSGGFDAVWNSYRAAVFQGDLAAAGRLLADPALTTFPVTHSNVIIDPVSLYRAILAHVTGDQAAARRAAGEAAAFYQSRTWNARQQPWVRMRNAMIAALTGDSVLAVREARAALAEVQARDVYDATNLSEAFGTVMIVAGEREEAIACLRRMMSQPCPLTPNEIRVDPLWSQLKADPRFEEILRAAKPL